MKSSGIGGQAVLEGVMMKNKDRYAVAVRKPDNQIEVKTDEFHGIGERVKPFRIPILRGVAAFGESLVLGIRTLTYSSGFYEEEEKEKSVSGAKAAVMDIGVVALSLVMAVAIFILLPLLLSNLLGRLIRSQAAELVFEGLLRIAMFVAYVALISKMNDIKRVFMYHGAEHKCINCVESGEDLTVANVRRQSRCHKRCGTSFLLAVMLVSFVLFMFIRVEAVWLRYVLRIALIPVIAGISYEFIRLMGSSDSKAAAVLSKPGLLLQGLTTREPDDSMIEVAIASVEAVFDWQAYQEKEGIARRSSGRKKKQGSAHTMTAMTDEGEGLASLDRIFGMTESAAADESAAAARSLNGRKNKEHTGTAANAMMAPMEEEEDDILRALDRFFVYEGDKTVVEPGEPAARKEEEKSRA